MKPMMYEELLYQAVLAGELEVDGAGNVWRLKIKKRHWKTKALSVWPCVRRRAETKGAGGSRSSPTPSDRGPRSPQRRR
jgi:hypothetical protein